MKNSFVNIITPVFKDTNTKKDVSVEQHSVALNMSGVFELDAFALGQFIKGSRLWLDDQWSLKDAKTVDIHTVMLMSTLHDRLITMQLDENVTKTELKMDRADILLLKEFLELRMKHCEIERDNRVEAFNPDSYISMKILLIDIREWLLGDIVDEMIAEDPTEEQFKKEAKEEETYT